MVFLWATLIGFSYVLNMLLNSQLNKVFWCIKISIIVAIGQKFLFSLYNINVTSLSL